MARLTRAEVFAANEIALVHMMNRTVRRCFLLGDDPVTGKNYDHRKQWIDDQLSLQAKHFGIDLICQAILTAKPSTSTPKTLARNSNRLRTQSLR